MEKERGDKMIGWRDFMIFFAIQRLWDKPPLQWPVDLAESSVTDEEKKAIFAKTLIKAK